MRPSVSTLRGFFYGWAELGVYLHVNQKLKIMLLPPCGTCIQVILGLPVPINIIYLN